jgi:type IV secretory pathway VirB10-like protein
MATMLRALIVTGIVFCVACGGKKDKDDGKPPPAEAPAAKPAPPASPPPAPTEAARPVPAEKPSTAPGPTTPEVADAPAGNPPPDGKYERVVVEGVTVPMVNIMNGGTVVLVDTDGKKPRTWEEQYKKKNAKLAGQLDLHKTDANKNGSFDDDAIDREGIWLIDAKGNITKH